MPPGKMNIGKRLRRARRHLTLRPHAMANSMGMSVKSYYSAEAGERRLYISELLQLYRQHGIAPNDVLLSRVNRSHFATVNAEPPSHTIMRAIVSRYLKLPREFRSIIADLIDSLHATCIERGEIRRPEHRE